MGLRIVRRYLIITMLVLSQVVAGPATAFMPVVSSLGAAAVHCDGDEFSGSMMASPPACDGCDPAHHPGAPNCCHAANACHGICAGATAAIPPTVLTVLRSAIY